MKRNALILAGVGILASLAFAQSKNLGAVDSFVKQVSAANTLSAKFTFTQIGGVSDEYSIALSKPNKLNLVTPTQTIVSDGATLTTYDKKAKTYFKQPVTPQLLAEALSGDQFALFQPFFDEKSYSSMTLVNQGTKKRKGQEMKSVEVSMDGKGKKTGTFYLDSSLVARQVELLYSDNSSRYLIDTQDFNLGAPVDDALFAFKAPSGARELTAEEMNSDKWYGDLGEALKAAKASNRRVLLDVMASWCGPCKRLEAEVYGLPEFKKYSKYFVFCKIDSDQQPDVAKRYDVTALPTVSFLKDDGTRYHSFVGYGGPAQVFAELDKAVQMGR